MAQSAVEVRNQRWKPQVLGPLGSAGRPDTRRMNENERQPKHTDARFTSSERLYGGDWVLAAFDDYMLSRCPAPYGFDNPAGLYPNATAGRW